MTFLESLCVGEAHEVITGLSCLENRAEAYTVLYLGNVLRRDLETQKD